MPPKDAKRCPVNIDNDEVIDFSIVRASNAMRMTVPAEILRNTAGFEATEASASEATAAPRAVDARLDAYVHRRTPRRRIGFCCGLASHLPTLDGEARPSGTAAACSAASRNQSDVPVTDDRKEQLEAFWREETACCEEESRQMNRRQYEQQLRGLSGATSPLANSSSTPSGDAEGSGAAAPHHAYSLLEQFFVDGVPDVEPWDHWALTIPRYNSSNIAASINLGRVVHPTLPPTHYSRLFLHANESEKIVMKLPKTKSELRVERQERMQRAKEERERAKRAGNQMEKLAIEESFGANPATVTITTGVRDRLSNRNLRYNLFGDSVLNPLGTDNKVFSQYQQRFLEHQRRNHKRHVEAIPHQIEKRKQDIKRHAEERPVFRAYNIYPIYSPAHLGKLRNFANDSLLRGFVLWVCQCHAIVVLSGGEVAVRHLERWILEKMKWESADTAAVRLMACPLLDATTFSFVRSRSRKRDRQNRGGEEKQSLGGFDAQDEKRECVYMSFVDSAQAAEAFMCDMPTEGPWRDLTHVWRAAVGTVVASSAAGSGSSTEKNPGVVLVGAT